MVKLEEINSTSTFAWSLDNLPLLVTGTVAGAVNINFDSSSSLEIWDIFTTKNNQPIFKAPVDNRFYAIAWSKPIAKYAKGIIVGAFEDGTLEFWDAAKLLSSKNLTSSSIHKSSIHKGPVKSLQFNPISDNILVSGGSNGQIFIWNIENFQEQPFSPGQAMTPMDEITCVAWNNSVGHIFASTGNGGYTSVWDLKTKREVLHLQYTAPNGSRASFSHVAWHPTQSTKLITASDSDSCPLILTWDLRNSNEPEKILQGHKKGILSLDWCKHDPNLLISSGKDNNTLLWNPITGEKLGEYPITANWTFLTRFAPSAPEYFATASFDGKVIIQSLQDTSPPVSTKVTSKDDNTFWNQLSTTETQQPVFDVKQAPIWLNRPSNVSFGFGSKLVTITKDNDGKSVIKISKVNTGGNQSISSDFIEALNSNDFNAIIASKLENADVSEIDKSDWAVLQKLSQSSKDALFKEISEDSEIEAEPVLNGAKIEASDDSFFDNLETKLDSTPDYTPEGGFKLFNDSESDEDNRLIKLILAKKIDKAVEVCLKQNKLEEAFVLALDGSNEIKQKVKNAYFKKNSKNTLSRVLYNVTANNVTDLVFNAEVDSWKEIATSISSFTSDSAEFNQKITELGDRILTSGNSKEQRDNAITCYLAGNALDKIASIWLKELPDFETKLLKSETSSVSTPSEARLETLTNFAQKISAYRSISNETGSLSGPAAEQIAKSILEYCNLLAGNGEFDLAEKFLNLLPSEFGGVEKDRILRASNKGSTNGSTTKAASKVASSGRSSFAKPNVAPVRAPGSGYAPPANTFAPPALNQPNQYMAPTPTPPPNPLIPANSYAAPSSRQPPLPQQSITPSAPTNPYARTNPYTPQATHNNIYKNPNVPAPGVTSPPPPPGPPKASFKKETGWNDLPDTFKSAAPPRRAASSQTLAASPLPTTSSSPAPPGPSKLPSLSNVPVPPPIGTSRKSSTSSIPQQVRSPRPTAPQINNRYAPPPNAISQPQTPGSTSTPAFSSPPQPTKNPYAPAAGANPPRVSYAPPPVGQIPSAMTSPKLAKQTPLAPPKNPYAPPPKSQQPNSVTNPYGPPTGGIAPPPQQSFGGPQPGVGQAPNLGVLPPPPMGGIAPTPNQFGGAPAQYNQFNAPPPAQAPAIQQQPPAAEPEKPKYPAGDRSHINENAMPIFESLNRVHEAIKPVIPEKYEKHAQDMQKRLNFLFDHLNNDDLLSEGTIQSLKSVCSAIEARDFANAASLNIAIATNHPEEVGNWHVGVKRLITMAEAMY